MDFRPPPPTGPTGLAGGGGAGPDRLPGLVEQAQAATTRVAAAQADQLRAVAALAREARRVALAELALLPRPAAGGPPDAEVARTAAVGEVQAALGISGRRAERLIETAHRLTRVLPGTLTALSDGRIDLPRAEALAEATRDLADDLVPDVEALMLDAVGTGPWAGPSPRAWRSRADRLVVTADADAARRRRERAVADRQVRAWHDRDGTGGLLITTASEDIGLADAVITDLALQHPALGPDGQRLSMDQRRVDAFIGLFRRVRDGHDLPTCDPHTVGTTTAGAPADGRAAAGPRRDVLGLVLHTDTLLGDGPAAAAPGQQRGLGQPATVDPVTARDRATNHLAAGGPVQVLLATAAGALARIVPLPAAPDGGWTRAALTATVRAALPGLPAMCTEAYQPTDPIAAHVRAAHPRCTAYDCARLADRCDLDHDRPWPRGPTAATAMAPRCRRHHEHKTRGLVQTRLRADGVHDTQMLSGILVRTRPDPLPGHGPGEGYDTTPTPATAA